MTLASGIPPFIAARMIQNFYLGINNCLRKIVKDIQ